MSDVPDGLHEREYAMFALENGIGRPATKANLELISSCIKSISKTKGMSLPSAMRYLIRAVKLANEQYVTVDYAFFADAVYLKMRPKSEMASYKPVDRQRTAEEQATPEFKALQAKMDALLKSFGCGNKMSEAK